MKPIPTEDGKGDYDMDLLKQCQQCFEQDEAQKVIDTLEAIPAEEHGYLHCSKLRSASRVAVLIVAWFPDT